MIKIKPYFMYISRTTLDKAALPFCIFEITVSDLLCALTLLGDHPANGEVATVAD